MAKVNVLKSGKKYQLHLPPKKIISPIVGKKLKSNYDTMEIFRRVKEGSDPLDSLLLGEWNTSLRHSWISFIEHEFNAIHSANICLLTQYLKLIAPNNPEGRKEEKDRVLCCNLALYHSFSFFLFCPHPWHIEVPGPGMESEAQLWPMPELQQSQILNQLPWLGWNWCLHRDRLDH